MVSLQFPKPKRKFGDDDDEIRGFFLPFLLLVGLVALLGVCHMFNPTNDDAVNDFFFTTKGPSTSSSDNLRNANTDKNDDDNGPDSLWFELIESFTEERLTEIANQMRNPYRNAYPFPHMVIDDLFPKRILEKIMEENPESLATETGCLPDKQSCLNHAVRGQTFKSGLSEESKMGPYTRMFMAFLKSSIFVNFLKKVSGIRGLVPDPLFEGSGLHFTTRGGSLDIHADFATYDEPKLERRVNVFVFLNPEWRDEYGGHLEFWNKDMNQCGQKVAPLFGRFVMFSTTDFSYHGHPHPLACPQDRARRSIALYYYTNGRPQEECEGPCGFLNGFEGHKTLWQTPACDSCEDPTCNSLNGITAV